jgi:(heptosyl)LPS beta-1,4-glucosyltransferase
LEVDGAVRHLTGDILHHTYRNLADHIQRMNRYSGIQAERIAASSRNFLLARVCFSSLGSFFRHYIFRAGFLDGRAGFVLALMSAWGQAAKYLKAWEMRKD